MSLNLLAYVLETTRPALNMASCFSGFYDISLFSVFLFVYFLRLALIISRFFSFFLSFFPLCFHFVSPANSSANFCRFLRFIIIKFVLKSLLLPVFICDATGRNTWRGMRDLALLAAVCRPATKNLSVIRNLLEIV